MDTTNDFLIGVVGADFAMMVPHARFDRQQAIRLVAYLIVLGDLSPEDIALQVKAIIGQ